MLIKCIKKKKYYAKKTRGNNRCKLFVQCKNNAI